MLDYVADVGSGVVVCLGDTRLGDDATETSSVARGTMVRRRDEQWIDSLRWLG